MEKRKAGRPKNIEKGYVQLTDNSVVKKQKLIKSIRHLKDTTNVTNKSIAEVLHLPDEKAVSYYLKQADKEIFDDINELSPEELIGGLYDKVTQLTKHSYQLLKTAPKRNHQVYMQAIKLAGERLGEEIKFLKDLRILKASTNPLEHLLKEAEKLTPNELKAKLEDAKSRLANLDITKIDASSIADSSEAEPQDFGDAEDFDKELEGELERVQDLIMKKNKNLSEIKTKKI